VEQVKIIPIDDGQMRNRNKKYVSYMIYRQNSSENSTSFILDLKLNPNFNQHILIEYESEEIKTNTSNCLFYTGSVRHWGQSKSMVAISICSGLVSSKNHLNYLVIFLGWSYSPYSRWY
jgi:hypothetical protein